MSPSWGERFPPGKTCAEANEEDVWTRWRRRMQFVEDIRRMLGARSVLGASIGYYVNSVEGGHCTLRLDWGLGEL